MKLVDIGTQGIQTEGDEQVADFDYGYDEYEELQAEYDAIDEQIRVRQIKDKEDKR